MNEVLEIVAASSDAISARAAQFVCRVEGSAAFLRAAHVGDRVSIEPAVAAGHHQAAAGHPGWHAIVLTSAARQLRQLIVVFDRHPARGPGAGAELEAFRILSELTTAGPQLQALVRRDRSMAVKELGKHLELVCRQFEATAALDAVLVDDAAADGHFERLSVTLLDRSGGALSLTEAAGLLGITRQALHKRIAAGSALGLMIDGEIAVPKLQVADSGGRRTILPGIGAVTKLFRQTKAGPWMALQFLVEPDPNLARTPIEVLREGDERSVVRAARAHLRMDEE